MTTVTHTLRLLGFIVLATLLRVVQHFFGA